MENKEIGKGLGWLARTVSEEGATDAQKVESLIDAGALTVGEVVLEGGGKTDIGAIVINPCELGEEWQEIGIEAIAIIGYEMGIGGYATHREFALDNASEIVGMAADYLRKNELLPEGNRK